MKKTLTALLLSLSLLLSGCGQSQTTTPPSLKEEYDAFMEAVSPDYAYNIALELTTNPEFFNSELGGRTAGSDAEHAAADYLAGVMEEIGLSNVEKVAAPCDRWQFNGASFTVDGKEYPVYSYATASTPPEGITAEVVYAGKGTMWDYEDLDVEGKIVLVDVDQRADWWVTYPMLEADFQGAAAILAANVGGFSQVADDALNCQDICGPTSIPTLSIGLADSQELQNKMKEGPVTATLVVDNEVEIDAGTTYNIMGVLKGKSSDHQILVGGHYDVHFWGFQDDNCAVGLVLSMAKAMIDSGYQPENDIVFCLHGAEEWGSSYTQYDWTVNNVLEYYAMYFSPEVIAIQDDMHWGEGNQDNLYWGTGINFTKADVDAATRSLYQRYDEQGGDFSQEIAVYEAAIQAQTELLKELGTKEIGAMEQLAQLLG